MRMPSRRTIIKNIGIATSAIIVAPTIISACSRGKDGNVAPSDRINLAFIGAGNQAGNDVHDFLKDPRVQVTTI